MKLESLLEKIIIEESEKLIERYHSYHNTLELEYKRNKKRLGAMAQDKVIKKPPYWSLDDKFNPFYTRRKAKSIAKSVAHKINNKTYKPNEPFIHEIPKKPNGYRKVSIYQIQDTAVSKFYYNKLLAKNKHRFSSFSYAYRDDRNVHFAIQDISIDISNYNRIFISEFDFSDFFGSISHEYLRNQFEKNGFFISEEEKFVINSFLEGRDKGIPQGTSISLFLANLACWELDNRFEKEGLRFARYADDTIIWSLDYKKICNAFTIINEFSKITGIKINNSKSDGISLLSQEGLPVELAASKTHIDFLGYSIFVNNVSIRKESIQKIKKQISYIIYKNLIQPLKHKKLVGITIPNSLKDEHFLIAIMQIRRYLYGGLTDEILLRYLNGTTKRIYFKGIMSFYPLVNNEQQLKELDGWLLSSIYRALQLRSKLLLFHGHTVHTYFPFCLSREELLEECKYKTLRGHNLFKIPSFILMYKAIKKGLIEGGIERTMNKDSNNYNY